MLLAVSLTIKSVEVCVVVRFFRTGLDAPSYTASRAIAGERESTRYAKASR